jgi:PTH1 family peptidyl-tRNA hydrolase
MKVVVGLGNPGRDYEATRHNVGFMVVDELARGVGVTSWRRQFEAEVASDREGDEPVLYAKPQTFMNRSGRCVRQLLDFYQLSVNHLLVVCDDVNLELGRLRIRAKGSPGGHNGLKDVERHLGTSGYARLRIGVGAAQPGQLVDHVLSQFRPSELPVIREAVARAVQAVRVWVRHGTEVCMNQFNAAAKPDDPASPGDSGLKRS